MFFQRCFWASRNLLALLRFWAFLISLGESWEGLVGEVTGAAAAAAAAAAAEVCEVRCGSDGEAVENG